MEDLVAQGEAKTFVIIVVNLEIWKNIVNSLQRHVTIVKGLTM